MKKLYILVLLLSLKTIAQTTTIDNTFNPKDDGTFEQYIGISCEMLSDGKLLSVYGFENTGYWKIIRLNQNGDIDETFHFTDNCDMFTKIFANPDGSFYTINTYGTKLIKRYIANGSIDLTFIPPDFDGLISNIVLQKNGKIAIIGEFSKINNINYNGILRLNNNGSIDNTFKLTNGVSINTIAIQNDGKYVVGGDFFDSNGYKIKVKRLNNDGTNDDFFNVYSRGNLYPSDGFSNGVINNIKVQTDGKIIVSGVDFHKNNSVLSQQITRLNSDGTVDSSFKNTYDTSTWLPIPDNISSFIHLSNEKYLINTRELRTFLLNKDGSVDRSFSDKNTSDAYHSINTNMFVRNDKFIINGNYKATNGITRFGIHRLNYDGSLDLSFNPQSGPNIFYYTPYSITPSAFNGLLVLSDSKIMLMGGFTSYNDNGCKNICKLTQDGQFDTEFNLDPSITIIAEQNSAKLIMEQNDGKILILNPLFNSNSSWPDNSLRINEISKSIIRINSNGSLDNSFNFDVINSGYSVLNFKTQKDGKILLVGRESLFKKDNKFKLIRLNTDGTIDDSFNSFLFDSLTSSLEVLEDDKILVRGQEYYTQYNDIFYRLNPDGSKDNSFLPLHNAFKTIIPLEDGKALVSYQEISIYYALRLNSDNTIDTTFKKFIIPDVNLNLFKSGDNFIIPVSYNEYINNPNSNLFFVYDKNGNFKDSFGGSPYHCIIAQQNCDNYIVAGTFTTISGFKKNYIARYNLSNTLATPTPTGNINQSFTSGQTLSDLVVEGNKIQWYNTQNLCLLRSIKTTSKIKNTNVVIPSSTLLIEGTTYFATQTINGIESNYRLPVTVTKTLSTNDYTFKNLQTYPNPIESSLTISNDSTINSVEIYNLLGQIILSKKYDSINIKVDFSSLKTGVYLAKIYSDNKIKSMKVIKK